MVPVCHFGIDSLTHFVYAYESLSYHVTLLYFYVQIPTDLHPITKKSALETVLTVIHKMSFYVLTL